MSKKFYVGRNDGKPMLGLDDGPRISSAGFHSPKYVIRDVLRFNTLKQAENFIADVLEPLDPNGVHAGEYYID